MGDRIERVIRAVQELLHDLSVGAREERVVRYLVTELHKGRSFDEVLRDPYMVSNTDAEDRVRFMENPDTLRQIEETMAAEFGDYRKALDGRSREQGA
jgi:hypothetical protein